MKTKAHKYQLKQFNEAR